VCPENVHVVSSFSTCSCSPVCSCSPSDIECMQFASHVHQTVHSVLTVLNSCLLPAHQFVHVIHQILGRRRCISSSAAGTSTHSYIARKEVVVAEGDSKHGVDDLNVRARLGRAVCDFKAVKARVRILITES